MAIYTVHMRDGTEAGLLERAEEAVFIRDGFRWSAFVFGAFWLLAKRLWLALLGFAVLEGLIFFASAKFGLHPVSGSVLSLLLALLLGLEAANLQRWKLSRRGFGLVSVVQGTKLDDAERRFFSLFPSSPLGAAPVLSRSPEINRQRESDAFVIGLFPEPGGRA